MLKSIAFSTEKVATSIGFPSRIGALDCPSEPTPILGTSKLKTGYALGRIDCPEKNQDFGTKAKHITSILVFAKMVEVDPVTTDRYGSTVAFVKIDDTVVNEELIRQGLASVFTRYCDRAICEHWERLEDEARAARRGLWSMPNAIPPWEFRRRER